MDAQVGALVGDALRIHQDVLENETVVDAALPGAEALEMPVAHEGHQLVHHFLQRLDTPGFRLVGVHKGLLGLVQDLRDDLPQEPQLLLGPGAEAQLPVMQLTSALRQVHGMVPDALEFIHALDVVAQPVAGLPCAHMGREAHHIIPRVVRQGVDQLLVLPHPVDGRLVKFQQRGKAPLHIRHGQGAHLRHDLFHGGQGQLRRFEQVLIQHLQVQLVPPGGALVVGDDLPAQVFKDAADRQQQHGAGQLEYRMGVGNAAGGDGRSPEAAEYPQAVQDRDHDQHQHRPAEVEKDMHDTGALGVRPRADGADDGGGDAVPQVDADDDAVNGAEAEAARGGQGLEDAHGGAGALDGEGHRHARQVTQHRLVRQGEEQLPEGGGLRKGLYRPGHVHKAREENGEAHDDGARPLGIAEAEGHDKEDAHDGRDGGQGIRLEEVQPGGRRGIQVQQADDLPGDGGAHVGPDDDAQGLMEGNDPRRHQAGGQHDGGGGALYGGGGGKAQEEGPHRAGGELLHGGFQRPGGALLQSPGHEPHAVKEQGQPAEKGNKVENCHADTPYHKKYAGNTGTWTILILPQRPIFGNSFLGRTAKVHFPVALCLRI